MSSLINFLKEFYNLIASPQFQEKLLPIKIVFGIFLAIFISIIVFILLKSDFLVQMWGSWALLAKNIFVPKNELEKKNFKKWQKIKKRLEKNMETEYKLAAIEAYEMLDKNFKKMGYQGESLEERVRKFTPEEVSNLEEVLESIQICADIIHDPDYKLSKEKAQEIIANFEKVLIDLEVF